MIKEIPYLKLEDMPKVPFVYNGITPRFIRENKILLKVSFPFDPITKKAAVRSTQKHCTGTNPNR